MADAQATKMAKRRGRTPEWSQRDRTAPGGAAQWCGASCVGGRGDLDTVLAAPLRVVQPPVGVDEQLLAPTASGKHETPKLAVT